ncbi:MAG: 4-hydroxy-tetrahydrodipicolinate synthase [Spirochaetales bacterium]|nr:4-hydroxy-tetrahydrodipicolinate synthase [Spirochaetales bacterium]
MKLQGIYLPIITPFNNDEIDIDSYKHLIDFYIHKGIHGLIPLATTGEYPTIQKQEFGLIVQTTIECVAKRVPVFIGVSGNDTNRLIKKIKFLRNYNISGILCPCPYYNLPDQRGIYEHFLRLSEAGELNIIIYNIPYRTGRNIENPTIRRLAELPNIIGLKDSCGRTEQSMELLLNPPPDFSILTGHDTHYYSSLALGGNGGILASAHINTEQFISVYDHIRNNDHKGALAEWRELLPFIPLLFQEPNPAPIKFILHRMGLIKSSEVRLPLVDISEDLRKSLLKSAPEI